MTTEVYVFLSLFLVSVILHVVFAILKKDIIYKIAFSFHLPFLGCAEYFYLINFYPDSQYLTFLYILVYSFISVSAVLYMFLPDHLVIIPSLFYIAGNIVLYFVYKSVYYFYSISKPVIFLASLFVIAVMIFAVIFGNIKSFRKIFCYLVLNGFSLSVVCITFFNLIYEGSPWCVLAFIGALFTAAFTVLKTLSDGKRISFSEKFIFPAIPLSLLLFSISTALMYQLL